MAALPRNEEIMNQIQKVEDLLRIATSEEIKACQTSILSLRDKLDMMDYFFDTLQSHEQKTEAQWLADIAAAKQRAKHARLEAEEAERRAGIKSSMPAENIPFLILFPLIGRPHLIGPCDMGSDTTILQLKKRLQEWTGMPIDQMWLMYKTNKMVDDKCLIDYGIVPSRDPKVQELHRIDVILPIWNKPQPQ